MTKGGRNFLLLGLGSIAIAAVTTGTSLALYHNSGDIYLDRSRPGFLPDEKESSDEQIKEDYKFADSGNLDKATLTEYLNRIQNEIKHLDQVSNPFDPALLSDEALGIVEQTPAPVQSNSDNVDTNQDAQHIND